MTVSHVTISVKWLDMSDMLEVCEEVRIVGNVSSLQLYLAHSDSQMGNSYCHCNHFYYCMEVMEAQIK